MSDEGIKPRDPRLWPQEPDYIGPAGVFYSRVISREEFERDYPKHAEAVQDAYAEQARTGFAAVKSEWHFVDVPWWRRLFRKLEDWAMARKGRGKGKPKPC